MFTGLVEGTGVALSFTQNGKGWALAVDADMIAGEAAIGDSIAVNGCCLTLARREEGAGVLGFDLLEETRRLTGFSKLKPGARVNLEQSLRAGAPIGGHFVTGHIDTVGSVEVFEPRGADQYLRIRYPGEFDRYIVKKGSIAIDGVSLTVAEAGDGYLAVWLIPHTLKSTNFGERRKSDAVNLEFDILGKHVEKLLAFEVTKVVPRT